LKRENWLICNRIIQEVVIAHSITVFCGDETISWENLTRAACYLQSRFFESLVPVQTSIAVTLSSFVDSYRLDNERGLHQLLASSRYSLATDPRDHVYALLGLASDGVAKGIVPDYSKDFSTIYISTVIQIIQYENRIDILSQVIDSKLSGNKRLPSWVPNWAALPRATALLSLRQNYSAAGDSAVQVQFSSRSLHTIGYSIDKIKKTCIPLFSFNRNDNRAKIVLERFISPATSMVIQKNSMGGCLLLWEKFASQLSSYPTGESVDSAYYQTLIASQKVPGENAPSLSEVYRIFKHFWIGK
jgi:hypothetical protein